jgi:hypothetical protein
LRKPRLYQSFSAEKEEKEEDEEAEECTMSIIVYELYVLFS